ncbi:hypothetical protein BH18ACI5_BH18ACI5_17360 [soil metagenome]
MITPEKTSCRAIDPTPVSRTMANSAFASHCWSIFLESRGSRGTKKCVTVGVTEKPRLRNSGNPNGFGNLTTALSP